MSAMEEAAMQLVAFVYMPEHVQLLVYPTSEVDIGRFLAVGRQYIRSIRSHEH